MRLILFGPPGSGKGTQAKLLNQRRGLCHIATGDILREAIQQETAAGLMAKSFVLQGQLVPDQLVNDIVAERFRRPDRPEQFVMDGYPRTLAQALAFGEVLQEVSLGVQRVIALVVADQSIVERLSGRWNCPNPSCKATFHTRYKPPRQAGLCDDCGTALVQRDDDREATVRNRLAVYHQTTAELLEHYRQLGLLREVAGVGDIEEIYANIAAAL